MIEKIEHLRIIRHLAVGGSADIYKAFNEKLDVERVVKLFKPMCSEEVHMRLKTEAKILANLRHPNVVKIYAAGDHDGSPYIEMEYVDGCSVEQLIFENPGGLQMKQSLSIAYNISQVLHLMATKTVTIGGQKYTRLIHRDIKPGNILIGRDGVPKLADFGVARPQEVSLHTVHTGGYIGTLAYLSPEQFSGENTLDGRVDIYALGAVLYEMVTGHKAFPQKNIAALIYSKMMGQYTPIQDHRYRGVAKIVKKCLSVERERRYATAQELCEAIQMELKAESPGVSRVATIAAQNVGCKYHRVRLIIVIGIVGTVFFVTGSKLREVKWNDNSDDGSVVSATWSSHPSFSVIVETDNIDATYGAPDSIDIVVTGPEQIENLAAAKMDSVDIEYIVPEADYYRDTFFAWWCVGVAVDEYCVENQKYINIHKVKDIVQ